MLKYPQSLRESGKACNHAELTNEGVMKLRMNKENKTDYRLVAGTDYAVKDEGGEDWIAYTDPNTNHFRHTWIITKRKRPGCSRTFRNVNNGILSSVDYQRKRWTIKTRAIRWQYARFRIGHLGGVVESLAKWECHIRRICKIH